MVFINTFFHKPIRVLNIEMLQNLPPYHAVFAQSQSEIISWLGKDEEEIAKKIMKHNIIYAYTLWRTEKDIMATFETIQNEIDELNMDKYNWDRLLILMVIYQTKAGIKPTQIMNTQSTLFNKMVSKLQAPSTAQISSPTK